MRQIYIAQTASYLPETVVTNDQLSEIMDTSDEWISQRTGIKSRHISTNQNTSDLALQVAQSLLAKSKLAADQIDLIIVATMSPDYLTPSTAAIVQGQLGENHALAFDLSAACSGFSYALDVAKAIMQAEQMSHALVIGAEVLSKIIDWRDRTTAVLFGDGAGGVLLSSGENSSGILASHLTTTGALAASLTAGKLSMNGDLTGGRKEISPFQMDGRAVYKFATHEVPKSILATLEKAGMTLDQVDYFLLHQANSRIIDHVAKELKLPREKFPTNIDRYGNTSGASEAILLDEVAESGLLKRGMIIVLSGFGAGLTTGTLVIRY